MLFPIKRLSGSAAIHGAFARFGLLFAVVLALAGGAIGAEAFNQVPGGLRLFASFRDGQPQADRAEGDARMSGTWMAPTGRRPQDFSEAMAPRQGGGFAFRADADAAFRGVGNLNLLSGTFAFRINRGGLYDDRGRSIRDTLFTTRGFYAGSARRGQRDWALGVSAYLEQYMDGELRPRWRRHRLDEHGLLALTIGETVHVADRPVPAEGPDWVHVAAAWDADRGVRFYVDGEDFGGTWGEAPFGFPPNFEPIPDRLRIESHRFRDAQRELLLTDLAVFDYPLGPEAVIGLAAGQLPDAGEGGAEGGAPGRGEAAAAQRRMESLGWGPELDGDLIPLASDHPVLVREQVVERAWEDMRAAGHLAVDGRPQSMFPWHYHGYTFLPQRRLHLAFFEKARPNYLVAYGGLQGTLRDGGSPQEPDGGADALRLPGSPAVFRRRLEQPLAMQRATVVPESGRLGGLHFYAIEEGRPDAEGTAFHLHGQSPQELPLQAHKREEFLTRYAPAERDYLVGAAEPAEGAERRTMAPLEAHHLLTAPMEEDFPLGAVGLRLHLEGLEGPARMQVRVHDGFGLWRQWGRFDFLLDPGEGRVAVADVTMDIRETLVRGGDPLWLTVVLDQEATLLYDPQEAPSAITLHHADEETARSRWLEWEMAAWRDSFEMMSEPRPWGSISDDPVSGWWLAASAPMYEHMQRTGRELLRRYPDEHRVLSWFQFIHPQMDNPARDWPLPDPGGHPEWAVLARENLRLYHHFVDWWTTNRGHENGEFGNFHGDDSCLLQDWVDMALIHDPKGRYARAVRRFADGVWSEYQPGGRPLHEGGLNVRGRDGLHSYEEGINVQPLAMLLDYGNPILFERHLLAASHYDGFFFTSPEDGMRRYAGDPPTGRLYWGADRPPVGDPNSHIVYLVTHPGLMLCWYSGHATALQILREWGRWKAARWDRENPYRTAYGGTHFFRAMYAHTGQDKYLRPVRSRPGRPRVPIYPDLLETGTCLDAQLLRALPEGKFDPQATYEASRADAETRFESLETTQMGFGDRRFERNWIEWRITRDKAYLVEGLRELYRKLAFMMPTVTVAEQSGDRVSIPKQLVSTMYLGGVPAARMYLYPECAVSYEGMNTNFAALVTEDRPDLLRIVFYNFDEAPQRGLVRVWNLAPGRYAMRSGPDRSGDDEMDEVAAERTVSLLKGDGVELELPSQRLWVWEASLVEREGPPMHERPDLAVSAEDAQWNADGSLTVQVRNIGARASAPTQAVLQAADGRTLETQSVPALDAPLDFRPKAAAVTFRRAASVAIGGTVAVKVDPEGRNHEITRRNNRAAIVRPAP